MKLKTFDELTTPELYAILKLRQDVFVVEQDCVYADIDGYDDIAWHLMGYDAGKLIAYLRIFAPGIKNTQASIGRIIVHPDARGGETGPSLIREGIRICSENWPGTAIYIEAQAALRGYYRKFGFLEQGEVYEWDGIDHIQMVRAAE